MRDAKPTQQKHSIWEVLKISTRLGLTPFGGPVAHLGYFHDEYIKRRKWVDENNYADLVALCQFLPGPASSQLGIALGTIRAGIAGGLAAWIGFTLPSVLALVIFASLLQGMDIGAAGWIHGLKVVAVAVVAHAIWGMGKNLAPDRTRISIAVVATIVTLVWTTAFVQVLIIVGAGLAGVVLFKKVDVPARSTLQVSISKKLAVSCWLIFFGLLAALPLIRQVTSHLWIAMFDSFYRAGSLVFGGGHVVLPLLEREVVPAGWVSGTEFLAGYGAAQAVPGPLFTFAAYLGAVTDGWMGAVLATIAIFLPSFLLVIGSLAYWHTISSRPKFRAALLSINAAVVGILLGALYAPLWTSTIISVTDFCLALAAFSLLAFWKTPPWLVVLVTAIGGMIVYSL